MLLNIMLWHSDLEHANSGARDLVFILSTFPFGCSWRQSVCFMWGCQHSGLCPCWSLITISQHSARRVWLQTTQQQSLKLVVDICWHSEFLGVDSFDLCSAWGHRGTSWTSMSSGLRWRWSQWKVIPCLQSCCLAELDKPNCTKLFQTRRTYKAHTSYDSSCFMAFAFERLCFTVCIQEQWRFQKSVPLNMTLSVHLFEVGAGAFKEDDSDEAVTEGSLLCRERCQV